MREMHMLGGEVMANKIKQFQFRIPLCRKTRNYINESRQGHFCLSTFCFDILATDRYAENSSSHKRNGEQGR